MSHQTLNEAQRAAVRDAIAGALTGVYYCGRVWSAWGIGTMSQDDFTPAANVDEVLDALTDAAVEGMAQAASVPGAEKVPCSECKGSGGTSVHAAIHHGEHACTDCNGKGFNWEPTEPCNQGASELANLQVRADGIADRIKAIAEKDIVMRSDKHQLLDIAESVHQLASTSLRTRAQQHDPMVVRDAGRWRAFLGSARIRTLGSAGLRTPEPNNYAHMGLEIWTKYDVPAKFQEDCARGNALAIDWLTTYADVAAAAQAEQAVSIPPAPTLVAS